MLGRASRHRTTGASCHTGGGKPQSQEAFASGAEAPGLADEGAIRRPSTESDRPCRSISRGRPPRAGDESHHHSSDLKPRPNGWPPSGICAEAEATDCQVPGRGTGQRSDRQRKRAGKRSRRPGRTVPPRRANAAAATRPKSSWPYALPTTVRDTSRRTSRNRSASA